MDVLIIFRLKVLKMSYIKRLSSSFYNESDIQLLCVHHAGGGASFFYPWAKYFNQNTAVSAIQLSGREELLLESPVHTMKEVIENIWPSFVNFIRQPYFLFGHSLGALICFELTQKAFINCLPLPKHLIVSACRAPHILSKRSNFHNISDVDLLNQLKGCNGISEELLNTKEFCDIFLPIIKADFSIAEYYLCSNIVQLPVNITALSGRDDPLVDSESIKSWEKHTSRKFNQVEFSGGHFFLKSSSIEVLQAIENIKKKID